MTKVFFDTNIMIDVIGRREQFCQPSLQIFREFAKFMKITTATLVDSSIIKKSVESKFKDFEDAMQYFSAKHEDVDYIITRNKKDFTASDIPVFEPQEYVDYLLNPKEEITTTDYSDQTE